jgi:hypothetical protein
MALRRLVEALGHYPKFGGQNEIRYLALSALVTSLLFSIRVDAQNPASTTANSSKVCTVFGSVLMRMRNDARLWRRL